LAARTWSDAPHRGGVSQRLGRLLDPFLLASNAALYGLFRGVQPTSTVVFREPIVNEADGDRPIIWITWHRLNYVATPAMLALPERVRPTIICHDGVASRAFSHFSAPWIGLDVFVFRRRSPVSPREQIVKYIRETGRSILNLPDSGGPYGKVKLGILEVARAADARIIPFVVDAKPSARVGKTLEHVIPLPFSRFEVRRGPALDASATASDLQDALDALG
jgi:hypothetical protein